MTVTESLMKPGQFSVTLTDDAPRSVWLAAQEFDHVVITPTRLLPLDAYTDAAIKAAARYTGVILDKPRGRELLGAGLGHWMGTDKGAGDLIDVAIANTAGSLPTWVTSLRPSSIAAGTVTDPGGTLTHSFQWVTRREALDWVCKALGAEWRINPDATLDAAAASVLFVTTPTAMITKRAEGADSQFRAVEATKLEQGLDVLDYATKIIVVSELGDGAKVPTQTATGANLYKDFHNNNVVMERLVNATDAAAAAGANFASNVLALYSTPRKSIDLDSDTYALTGFVRPGDSVYVFDVDANLYDTANQVFWRGQTISPVKLRCRSLTWPVQRGMGVYARRSGATPTYTDLTPWVEWENTPTKWEVGTGPLDPAQDESQLSPAYLGVNPDVMLRTKLGAYKPFTPAYSGAVTGGTPGILAGFYRVIGDQCDGYIAYSRGATDTHPGAGALVTFGIPPGLTPLVADGTWVGGARLNDGATPFGRGVYTAAGGLLAMMSEAGAFVTAATPWAFGTGDTVFLRFEIPIV